MAPKKKEAEPEQDTGDPKASMETELVVAILKSRLGRYQEAGERLAIEGFKLTDELAKHKLTLQVDAARACRTSMNSLQMNLRRAALSTTQLEEQVVELTAKLQAVQKETQAEATRVQAEAAAEVKAATSRVAELSSQLESSSEFLQQREAMESQLTQLRAALAAKTKEIDQKLSDLDRRQLQDKERARQEMVSKIRETKIAMAQLADQHLEGSTKRTLAENEAMAGQLAYHEAASARLVEANNALKADVGELHRQLGIAHKTVESTARNNLLLQQTIKGILQCLQQEGPAAENEAAAAAASAMFGSSRAASPMVTGDTPGGSVGCSAEDGGVVQLQQCWTSSAQVPVHPNTSCASTDTPTSQVAVRFHQCQQHMPGEPGRVSAACAGNGLISSSLADGVVQQQDHAGVDFNSSTTQQPNRSRQQQLHATALTTTTSSGVAGDIVQQLEQRVLQLHDDLTAAKQALAAAMQGLLPEGCAARVVVLPGTNTPTAAAEQQQSGKGQCSIVAGIAHHRVAGLRELNAQGGGGLSGRRSPVPGHNGAVRSILQASPDVVSKVDRSVVQQQQQQPSVCDSPSNSRGSCVSDTGGNRSTCAVGRSRSSSPASPKQHAFSKGLPVACNTCTAAPGAAEGGISAALDDGVAAFVLYCIQHLRHTGNTAEQLPGCSNVSSSACISPVGRGAQRHNTITAVMAATESGVSSEPTARESLARLLMEQLHGYAHHKLAAFQGLALELKVMEPVGNAAAMSATATAAAAGIDVATTVVDEIKVASSQDKEHCSGLLLPPSETAEAACNAWPAHNSREQQQQPVLQTLMDMAPVSPAGSVGRRSPSCAAASWNPGSSTGCSSTEDLFSAVLSDVRPWGSGSMGAARNALVSSSHAPTSPAALLVEQHYSSPKAQSPKLACPRMQRPVVPSSNGNMGVNTNGPSAGRLARAAEAASVTGPGALGEHLGNRLRGKPAGACSTPQ